MVPLGYTLLIVGFVLGVHGGVKILVVAYDRNLWWLLGCVIVTPVALVFLLLNLKVTIKPLGLSLLGLLVAVLGCWMSGIGWPN